MVATIDGSTGFDLKIAETEFLEMLTEDSRVPSHVIKARRKKSKSPRIETDF